MHTRDEAVVRLEEPHLLRQVPLDRLGDAAVQELRVPRRVEVAVVVPRVVQHLDIAARCRPPLDVGQQRLRVRLQHPAILVQPAQDHGTDREYEPRRAVLRLRQHVVNQPAVQPAVAILERMHVHEAERHRRGRDDRVHPAGNRQRSIVGHSREERRQVLGTGADVIRERLARVPVVLADKASLHSQSQLHEPVVPDHDPLQPLQLGDAQRNRTRLRDHLPPAARPLPRRLLAFDVERGAAVAEQQERSGPRQYVRMRATDHLPHAAREVACPLGLEFRRSPDKRAERRRTRQVVDHAMPRRPAALLQAILVPRIDSRNGAQVTRRRHIQLATREPLVQEPDPARVDPRRGRQHDPPDLVRGNGIEERAQHPEVQPLPLQRELELCRERIGRGVPRRQDQPVRCLHAPVPAADGRQPRRQRHLQPVPIPQPRVADRPRRHRQAPSVKSRQQS